MCKCLYCYKELEQGQVDFHPSCARRMFGHSVAPLLNYTQDEIQTLAAQVIRSQITLTGVQAKLSLDIEKHKHEQRFTIVGLWGKYILKPQTDLYPSLPELEDLTMHLAQDAEIAVVPHTLIRFADGKLCYLTRRIDRTDKGQKLPMEDCCQLMERLTEHKYRGSYEQVAKVILKYADAPLLNVTEFWRVVIFSWLTGNSDMHLKNFSLYAPDGKTFRLTPAYDLLNTLLVMKEDTEELALNLNGKKSKLKRIDFVHAMTGSGMSEKATNAMLDKFATYLPAWQQTISRSFVSDELKQGYVEMLQERLARLKG